MYHIKIFPRNPQIFKNFFEIEFLEIFEIKILSIWFTGNNFERVGVTDIWIVKKFFISI